MNFSAFMVFGLIPIIPCFFSMHEESGAGGAFVIAILGVLQLFTLGYMKAYLIGANFDKRRDSGF